MSFTYNSDTWTPRSTTEHAQDIMGNINSILKSQGVSDSDLLKASADSAIWIHILAIAQLRADFDLSLYEAQNSFNPSLCNDNQVLNLLPITGTEMQEGTYSTVDITCTATSEGSCEIPEGAQLPYTDDIYFEVLEEVIIPAGESAVITVQANQKGPITVLENQLTVFSSSIANLESVTSEASIEGTPDETVTEARQRIIKGKVIENNLDGLMRDLNSLQGIGDAVVYFNPDSVVNLELEGGVIVSPRTCRIFIYGDSDKIAETFWKRELLKTEGAESQIYTTLAGQEFDVKYDYATDEDVYVRIYIPEDVSIKDSVKMTIKNIILSLQTKVRIGQSINSAMIDQLFEDFTGVEIVDSELSLNGVDYDKRAEINAGKIASFSALRIEVVNMT